MEYSRDDLVAELEELGATDEQLAVADIARGQVGAWIAERVGEASDPALAEAAYATGEALDEVNLLGPTRIAERSFGARREA